MNQMNYSDWFELKYAFEKACCTLKTERRKLNFITNKRYKLEENTNKALDNVFDLIAKLNPKEER